jgi:hypothetical protein
MRVFDVTRNANNYYFLCFEKKTQKNVKKNFKNFFEESKNGQLFLSIFQILKRVSKK